MFTPLELQKQQFKKKMGGYSKSDVDEFFNLLATDYETLYKENIRLKDKVSMLDDLVNKYKGMEDTMQNTLVLAQRAADDLNHSAQEKSRALIENAQMEAQALRSGALDGVRDIEEQKRALKRELIAYGAKAQSLIDAQSEIIKQILQDDRSDNNGLHSNTKPSQDGLSDARGTAAEGTGDTVEMA